MTATYGSYADFLKIKQQLEGDLESAMLHTLEGLGEGVKGISWFSSRAEEYSESLNKYAA